MYSSCTVESYPTNLSREVTAISTPGDRRYSVSSFVSEAETNQELEYFIPPPEGFSNNDTVKSCNIIQRDERPSVPAKPQFMANVNMNNNNRTTTKQMEVNGTGTKKLRNLMLLRQPAARKPVRRHFSSYDDSLSDTEESSDSEPETDRIEEKQTSNEPLLSSSASSFNSVEKEDAGLYVVVKISIPEQKLTKCMHLKITETVWTAKQRIIQSLVKKFNDPLNYGLFHEKSGSFLFDHFPVSEYIEAGSVGTLQMRYKCRIMEEHSRNSKEGKQVSKMQSASKRREFLSHVQQYTTDKIYAMIRKGIDPNFHCPNTGETPLTILSSGQSRPECVAVFMALMGGGAHLDFRNQRSFTPMHVAARDGNIQMLKTLIEFEASPNVLDGRDLTPLYHCVLLGSDPAAASVLISSGSNIGCCDSQGWSEIHQACRHGRIQLLELLLSCDKVDASMVNARNASGNTPLHVCALYNQEMCAVTLLKHSADVTLRNFSNQDAIQVAHVAGNINVAELIEEYPNHKENDHLLLRMRADSVPTTQLPLSPSRDTGKKANSRSSKTHNAKIKHSPFVGSLRRQFSGRTTSGKKSFEEINVVRPPIENRFDSQLPPNAKIPVERYVSHEEKQTSIQENGTTNDHDHKVMIVIRNYDAQTPEEVSLRVGTRAVVLNGRTPPAGYHDGVAGSQRGFFPRDCVEEVKLRRALPDTTAGSRTTSNDSSTESRTSEKSQVPSSRNTSGASSTMKPDSISLVSFASSEDAAPHSPGGRSSVRSEDLTGFQATSQPGVYHYQRTVALRKGDDGFGFILRGAKAEGPVKEFNPSLKCPALQYLESIESGSNAHNAGLRSRDFIIKIGNVDVRKFGHQQVVSTIRSCGEPLYMEVITVLCLKPKDSDTSSLHSNSSGRHYNSHGKSDSISSALDQLDNVLAMEDNESVSSNEQTATLRRLPGRKMRSEDIQDLFTRQNGTAEISSHHRPTLQSTFSSSRRPICVLPPSLPMTNSSYTGDDTVSMRSFSTSASTSAGSYPTWGRFAGANNVPTQQPMKAQSMSAATGERILSQQNKQKKMPPPPPKRTNSRLSVSIQEENESNASHAPLSSAPPKATQGLTSDLASAIAMAARTRANRLSQTDESTSDAKPRPTSAGFASAIAMAAKTRESRCQAGENTGDTRPRPTSSSSSDVQIPKPVIHSTRTQENANQQTQASKTVNELSSALSIALAAKQRSLEQRNVNGSPGGKKSHGTSFTVDPSRSSGSKIQKSPQHGSLSSPSTTYLPPPPPSSDDSDSVSGISPLPPPPDFPSETIDEHHTRYNHMTFDELMDLPPPPLELLHSPNSNSSPTRTIKPPEEFRRPVDGKVAKSTVPAFLPPPPLPPPGDDDEDGGCISPAAVDNLSNADSGVADVTGDGLNNSGHHHHRGAFLDAHNHDHIMGDNHSTVSSVSTVSTMSSEDGNSDYTSSSSAIGERCWPIREVKQHLNDDATTRSSSPPAAGNMYLDVLKRSKSNKQSSAPKTTSSAVDSKKNPRSGITVTKMTFAPIASKEAAPPVSKLGGKFPPVPKQYSTTDIAAKPAKNTFEIKPAFGGPAAVKKVDFPLKNSINKAPQTTPVKAPAPPVQTEKETLVIKEFAQPVKSVNGSNSAFTSKQTESNPSSNNKKLPQWSVAEVSAWLKELGMEMYIDAFKDNEISGEHLPDLGKDELIELGVKRVGHRMTIDRSVKKLMSA